jgi:hypothetical protein
MTGPIKRYLSQNYERFCFLKEYHKNPNIVVGDHRIDDFEDTAAKLKNVRSYLTLIMIN